eukprot:5804403-Prymnesium_polylepis.2
MAQRGRDTRQRCHRRRWSCGRCWKRWQWRQWRWRDGEAEVHLQHPSTAPISVQGTWVPQRCRAVRPPAKRDQIGCRFTGGDA